MTFLFKIATHRVSLWHFHVHTHTHTHTCIITWIGSSLLFFFFLP
jgi:hypothetical protein